VITGLQTGVLDLDGYPVYLTQELADSWIAESLAGERSS
jgi:hypothetical protein